MQVDGLIEVFSAHRDVEELRVPALLNVDTENSLVLPSPRTAYLGRAGGYVRFVVQGETGEFQIDSVSEVVLEQYPDEPDIRVVELDLTPFYVGSTVPMRISGVELYRNVHSSPHTGLWRAALIEFESGPSLLLDPAWPDGINFGDRSHLHWLGASESLERVAFRLG